MPCFWATCLSVTISSCWWSVATLARSNIGAISNWPGATSLWRVLAGMPSLNSSRSASSMKPARARGWRRSSGRRTPGPSAAWRRTACGPALSRSGRAKKKLRSIRKYSCSAPANDTTGVGLVVAEQLEDPLGLRGHRLLRAQQRRLVVERLAGHRDEHRRDAQRVAVGVLEDVRRAGDVPAGVAAGLERGPQAAVGEARRVGLALDERLAGELGDRRRRRRRARGSCRASRR